MKRIKIVISTLLLFNGFIILSQETNFYDSNGILKADTSFQITRSTLEHVRYLEGVALYGVYESIEYPKLAYHNGVGGLVIARVLIMRGKLDAYCEIVKSSDPSLSEAVRNSFYKNWLRLIKASKTDKMIEFYVPFEFKVNESYFKEEIKKNKLIKIEKNHCKPILNLL